eukprot:6193810-Pleurochrysis_carterae.AAC.2
MRWSVLLQPNSRVTKRTVALGGCVFATLLTNAAVCLCCPERHLACACMCDDGNIHKLKIKISDARKRQADTGIFRAHTRTPVRRPHKPTRVPPGRRSAHMKHRASRSCGFVRAPEF